MALWEDGHLESSSAYKHGFNSTSRKFTSKQQVYPILHACCMILYSRSEVQILPEDLGDAQHLQRMFPAKLLSGAWGGQPSSSWHASSHMGELQVTFRVQLMALRPKISLPEWSQKLGPIVVLVPQFWPKIEMLFDSTKIMSSKVDQRCSRLKYFRVRFVTHFISIFHQKFQTKSIFLVFLFFLGQCQSSRGLHLGSNQVHNTSSLMIPRWFKGLKP